MEMGIFMSWVNADETAVPMALMSPEEWLQKSRGRGYRLGY